MSEDLRKRTGAVGDAEHVQEKTDGADTNSDKENIQSNLRDSEIDSEDDKTGRKGSIDLSSNIPTGTNKAPFMLEMLLQDLPDKWRNWVVRGIFSFLMLTFFLVVIYGGPLALMITTLVVQVKCFQEIINIGYTVYRIHGLPWFRSLSWYFLITSNYFFYGESLVEYFGVVINRTDFLRGIVTYHRFISFCLYCGGFVLFVLSLVKKYYMKQFSLFAWTHVALLIVVTQSYLIIKNIFEGLIWFIVPVSMIICNDIMAYVFGFFFGKTPLIKLSPKKTWEGFIGGGFSTVVFGFMNFTAAITLWLPLRFLRRCRYFIYHMIIQSIRAYIYDVTYWWFPLKQFSISYIMCQYPYFVCPIEYSEALGRMTMECEPSILFRPTMYELPGFLCGLLNTFGLPTTVSLYPFMLHSLSLSLFSSVIGPFGGFFASGFKRAFKIKDFGDVIPGHGGIMDRFDCQFLMATFVNVYISSFIQTDSPQKLLTQVLYLKPEQQLQLFHMLKDTLENRNILVPNV